jgi:hypothetical protein
MVVTPTEVAPGGTITVSITGLNAGSLVNMRLQNVMYKQGGSYNFEVDNLVFPINLTRANFTISNQNTATNLLSISNTVGGITTELNQYGASDGSGFWTFSYNGVNENVNGTYDYIRLQGSTQSGRTLIQNTMEWNGTNKAGGAVDFSIPFSVIGVSTGQTTVTITVNGTSIGSQTVGIGTPGKIGVFRNGVWLIDLYGDYLWNDAPPDRFGTIGQAGDVGVNGDWNSDGIKEIGVFRNGFWLLDYNGNGLWDGTPIDVVAGFGQAGDIPVVGVWNGATTNVTQEKIGVFRDGFWILDYNGNFVWDGDSIDKVAGFGMTGDNPVVANWVGTGTDKIGIFRNGTWLVDYNGNFVWDGPSIDRQASIGQTGDRPVAALWNGATVNATHEKIGVFRDGFWIIDYNGNFIWDGPGPGLDMVAGFGQAGDTPVSTPWNGAGTDKIGVFRDGFWIIDFNGNYAWDGPSIDKVAGFGQAGDTPIYGALSVGGPLH